MKFRDRRGKDDSDELLQLHKDWIDAELRGDVEQVLKLCTDDVQFLTPGARLVVGKQAVREFLVTSAAPLISVETFDVSFEASETLAFKTADSRRTSRRPPAAVSARRSPAFTFGCLGVSRVAGWFFTLPGTAPEKRLPESGLLIASRQKETRERSWRTGS